MLIFILLVIQTVIRLLSKIKYQLQKNYSIEHNAFSKYMADYHQKVPISVVKDIIEGDEEKKTALDTLKERIASEDFYIPLFTAAFFIIGFSVISVYKGILPALGIIFSSVLISPVFYFVLILTFSFIESCIS